MKKLLLSMALLAASTGPVLAATRAVTLSVPSMYCPVCPIAVKKALDKVPGVSRVTMDYDRRLAHVTYDDTRATPDDLMDATHGTGYPSTVVKKTQ